jgi:hypothetical protein
VPQQPAAAKPAAKAAAPADDPPDLDDDDNDDDEPPDLADDDDSDDSAGFCFVFIHSINQYFERCNPGILNILLLSLCLLVLEKGEKGEEEGSQRELSQENRWHQNQPQRNPNHHPHRRDRLICCGEMR